MALGLSSTKRRPRKCRIFPIENSASKSLYLRYTTEKKKYQKAALGLQDSDEDDNEQVCVFFSEIIHILKIVSYPFEETSCLT